MTDTDWDERFASGEYPRAPEPSPVLRAYEPSLPDGRALDVAAGTGRNAVFLADRGYEVDALDASVEGLEIVRGRAAERGIAGRIETIQADATTYAFPAETYDVITMSYFHTLDRFADLIESLAPDGVLFVEGHLRSAEPASGPSGDRYRYAANELLRAGSGLSVRYYDETTTERPGGRRRATARLLARKSTDGRQSYPPRPEAPERWPAADATPAERDP
ncbi:class I SAM-dependent methyltransferase [Halorubrum tebenquichense]|uniref:Methyltransferase type 11 n=1 Tax=Halorubrum tebenquichense DSM 14210 TaxID=1227485 RepID=M0E0M9_9EURY|nr:class I SAM-dependent methyltransferase [Halorubrum tebenquichense]ELZ41365.1 methyltransferase type 11 [Halorubrum tebenquichense DSM 14210]